MKKFFVRALKKADHLFWGYPTEFVKMAEKLLELFLHQNITDLKWRST
jgi:hypothetical protein